MRLLFLFAASSLILLNNTWAQDPETGFICGANEQPELLDRIAADPAVLQQAMEAKMQLDAFTQAFDGAAARNNYIIPVVFHIIHDHGAENISDAQVEDAVRILNEDLNNMNPSTATVRPEFTDIVADVGIQFELARRDPDGNCTNGITRTPSQLTYEGDFAMTQLIQWPRNNYLNIWLGASANGAAGYTYYPMWLDNWPEADGIVVQHSYVGSIGTSNPFRSHVLTHEVGHWLNLMHCWGNSNEPGAQSNCDMDDGVSDTPLTRGWTSCTLTGASCGSELDNVENYMEYSYCYKMFTIGQADRMLAALNSPIAQRNQLWQSNTLTAAGLNDVPALCAARFDHGRTEICSGGTVQFTDMSYHSVVERTWSFPGGIPSTSSEESPVVTYDQPGLYTVTLEVSDGVNTLSHTRNDLVRVYADPGYEVPFHEGFETVDAFPSEDWWTRSPGTASTFTVSSSTAYSGERSVVFVNSSGRSGEIHELRSPALNLAGAAGLSMSFRYAYAKRNPGNDDRLRIHFSINCGVNWSLRKQLRASGELTTAGIVTGNFIPQGPEDWNIAYINIPLDIFYVSDLLMRFEFLSDGGNNLYIDDINIHGSPVGVEEFERADMLSMALFPNPASGHTELILDNAERAPTRIVLRDVLGREIRTVLERTLDTGPQRIEISLEGLSSGVYMIEVQQGEHRHTLRAIKE